MGASWSTPNLVKPFSTFSLWSHEQSEGLLKQYQNSNFFFGIDSRELANGRTDQGVLPPNLGPLPLCTIPDQEYVLLSCQAP